MTGIVSIKQSTRDLHGQSTYTLDVEPCRKVEGRDIRLRICSPMLTNELTVADDGATLLEPADLLLMKGMLMGMFIQIE